MGLPERLAEKWTVAYRVHSTRFVTDAVREAVREALDEAATAARGFCEHEMGPYKETCSCRPVAIAAAIERLKEA